MVEPKNIAAIEDGEKVWVKFALPGYMESCQIYRKMGHYTDVKIHCIHMDSEDVTIYSAHNLLLSAASTYFSFVLVQAFTQLTELRTNNLKKVLHIIENDHTFVEKSFNGEENALKFNIPLYHNQSCCSQLHSSEAVMDNVDNHGRNKRCSKVQNGEKDICNVILKSFNSANNIIMVVKGIDPVCLKYVLKCIYSESFFIEKKHIRMFLSFIVHIKLTNFATLTTLLDPFIVTCSSQRKGMETPVANSNKNISPKSAFRLFDNRDDYSVLNSFYDVYQWKDANEFYPTLVSPAPLDLSSKSLGRLNNNNTKNTEVFPSSSSEQFPDRMSFNNHNPEAFKIPSINYSQNSIYTNFNHHQWYHNYEGGCPISNPNMLNVSDFSSNNGYNSRPDLNFQKINGGNPFWQDYNNFSLNNGSHNYPYINSNESKLNFHSEFRNNNSDYHVGSSSTELGSNSHCDREDPQLLQKLERNSSILVKRLDVPVDFEGILKNKRQPRRKTLSNDMSSIKVVSKKVKFNCEDHFTRSCTSVDKSNTHNTTNTELASKIGKGSLNDKETCITPKISNGKYMDNDTTTPTEIDKFKCFQCQYTSESVSEVIFHMRINHFAKTLRISKCVDSNCPVQLLFTSKEWETHIQHHFITYFYQCSSCTYSTKTKKGILRHEMTHKSSYNRVPKGEKEIYGKKKKIQRKCKLSRRSSKNNDKKERSEQLTESNPSTSEIQSCNVFETPTFKKLQRGLKKRRKDSAILHRIHLQISKITNGNNLKGRKSLMKTEKLFASEVIGPDKENGNMDSKKDVGKGNDKNECIKNDENMKIVNGTKEHSNNTINPVPSTSSGIQKIKTKTVRLLNKKKPKLLHCSLCKVVLSTEEGMTSHYFKCHNMILPFKCPYRNCDVYLDDTLLLYSHINIHAGENLKKSQINIPVTQSSETNQNDYVGDVGSDLDVYVG